MAKINCDLCGKDMESANIVLVEGAELSVCQDCSKFGKVLALSKQTSKSLPKRTEGRIITDNVEKFKLIAENYHETIKKGRESMGLSQKDFAAKVNEKESTIHKIETASLEPPLSLAEKLEKLLGIKIIEEHSEKQERPKKSKGNEFTIGDFIVIRKKEF